MYEPKKRDHVKVGRHGGPMSVRQVFPIGRVVIAVDVLAQRHVLDWDDLTLIRRPDSSEPSAHDGQRVTA